MLRCLTRADPPFLRTSITINKSIDYTTLMQKEPNWTSKGHLLQAKRVSFRSQLSINKNRRCEILLQNIQ